MQVWIAILANNNMAWKSKRKLIKILNIILPGRVYVTTRKSPEDFSSYKKLSISSMSVHVFALPEFSSGLYQHLLRL